MSDDDRILFAPEFLRALDQLAFATRRLFTGQVQGEKRSPKRGSSVEFADFRDYVPGDDLRYVDWNAFGRLDRLLIKLFVEEEDLSVHVLVDVSESMNFGEPTKFTQARYLAAALAYLALTSFDRVTVAPFTDDLGVPVGPFRGRAFAPKLFARMEEWTPGGRTNLTRAMRSFVRTLRRPGLVVVVSDFLAESGYEEALRLLVGHKHEVAVLHLLDETELAPPWNGDLKLVDAETGAECEVTMGRRTLRLYHQNLAAFLNGIESFCAGRRLTYTRVSTADPVEEVVLGLRRRGVVR